MNETSNETGNIVVESSIVQWVITGSTDLKHFLKAGLPTNEQVTFTRAVLRFIETLHRKRGCSVFGLGGSLSHAKSNKNTFSKGITVLCFDYDQTNFILEGPMQQVAISIVSS